MAIDATFFGLLVMFFRSPTESSLAEHARGLGNLEPYCDRMLERYF